ncbi:hypothetical protein JI721_08205 [Alicyclobacillus cycloheptanicus]|uniref:Uncharacterized protein n=1 Tax=Alicyclobacillus cycloheptanicus TaxID=1457 RepID=A0ABT9XM32_9BACL|nr:hypothetical protein [Alicyclobacillus cycloheptanicus]MDQ0190788.1 hypothetical protein [Alicyclobacillus cycloheptanicus]WDM02729.1 hypothetical protein JI721_08205 [Alicyclobacillus cycloheptanicus]
MKVRHKRAAVFLCSAAIIGGLFGCSPGNPANQTQADVANAIGMSAGSANLSTTKQWMETDSRHRVVRIRLVSDARGNPLLNGFRSGTMTLSVPQNWTVYLTFQNNSPYAMYRPVIVPYSERRETTGVHAIYPPSPGMMKPTQIPPGHADTERFRTNTVGRFVVVTARDASHRSVWANFVVSSHEPSPRIYTRIEG